MEKRKWTKAEVDEWMRKHDAFVYYNPSDKNIFVRKRFGIGWTLNLGNFMSYVTAIGLFVVIFLMVQFISMIQ